MFIVGSGAPGFPDAVLAWFNLDLGLTTAGAEVAVEPASALTTMADFLEEVATVAAAFDAACCLDRGFGVPLGMLASPADLAEGVLTGVAFLAKGTCAVFAFEAGDDLLAVVVFLVEARRLAAGAPAAVVEARFLVADFDFAGAFLVDLL